LELLEFRARWVRNEHRRSCDSEKFEAIRFAATAHYGIARKEIIMRTYKPMLAAALALTGGGGYFYLGQVTKGIIGIATFVGLCFVWPLLLLFLPFTTYDSYTLAKRLRLTAKPARRWDFFWSYPAEKPESENSNATVQPADLLALPYRERQHIVVNDGKPIKVTTPFVQIRGISASQAEKIRFPPGHPLSNIVYVGHPLVSSDYYPFAQFHRLTLEHKFCEAIRLLTSLGARRIQVQHQGGSLHAQGIDIEASIVSVGFTASKTAQSHDRLLFEATFKPTERPWIPPDLAWYQSEPTWQRVAEARMKNQLKSFSLAVSYVDSFGVDAKFKTAISQLGLDLGGNFDDHKETVWTITGDFGI
jgi:hypothetical protein